jgi:hypothetical protein
MSIKELDISPGSVFQIAVTPTLMSTTKEGKTCTAHIGPKH